MNQLFKKPMMHVVYLLWFLRIRGVWQSQTVALFGIRVIDTDTLLYLHWDVASVLSSADEEKKRKYNDAAEARRASFTPLVVSVDGVLG